MPNLTYWLFGGYLAWLMVSGQYKSMLTMVTTPAWKTKAVSTKKTKAASTTEKTSAVTPEQDKTGVKS